MLGDAQQAKRVRTVGQAPRSLVEIQRPSSRCAPSTTAQGMDQRAAASLLHAAAFGQRAPLVGRPPAQRPLRGHCTGSHLELAAQPDSLNPGSKITSAAKAKANAGVKN